MLSFSKTFTKFRCFQLSLFSNNRFRNCNYNIDNHFSTVHNLSQSALHCTVSNQNEQFTLLEIENLNYNNLNCDVRKWTEIVDEILRAKDAGRKLPEYVKMSDINDLIECETRTQRNKFLTYLFKKEKTKLNAAEKKLKKKIERENKYAENVPNTDHIQYGLGKNCLILRAWKRSAIKYYDKRLANSILFGQKIIFDLGYDELMTKKERRACASQVILAYSFNKLNPRPYNFYFCNANPESRCVQYLREEMPNIDESFATITEKSYLDIFPKESLVYLSPHASETLKTYDHKAIYIIGGFVDTVKRVNVSHFKAEEQGIKTYSLPLDEYVLWGCGSRSLSINQVFSIMQTMRDTGNWREAFKHIPTRKLRRLNPDSVEAEFCSDKLFVMNN